jgi:hypothetical protein
LLHQVKVTSPLLHQRLRTAPKSRTHATPALSVKV